MLFFPFESLLTSQSGRRRPHQTPTPPERIDTSQTAINISPNTAPKCIYSVNIYLAPSTPPLPEALAAPYRNIELLLDSGRTPSAFVIVLIFSLFGTSHPLWFIRPKIKVNKLVGVGSAVALASMLRPRASVGWTKQSCYLADTGGGPGGPRLFKHRSSCSLFRRAGGHAPVLLLSKRQIPLSL